MSLSSRNPQGGGAAALLPTLKERFGLGGAYLGLLAEPAPPPSGVEWAAA